jgi:hypothetical protein
MFSRMFEVVLLIQILESGLYRETSWLTIGGAAAAWPSYYPAWPPPRPGSSLRKDRGRALLLRPCPLHSLPLSCSLYCSLMSPWSPDQAESATAATSSSRLHVSLPLPAPSHVALPHGAFSHSLPVDRASPSSATHRHAPTSDRRGRAAGGHHRPRLGPGVACFDCCEAAAPLPHRRRWPCRPETTPASSSAPWRRRRRVKIEIETLSCVHFAKCLETKDLHIGAYVNCGKFCVHSA